MDKLSKGQIQSIVGEKILMIFKPQQDYYGKWVWDHPCYIEDDFKWRSIENHIKGCTYTFKGFSDSFQQCVIDYASECIIQCIGLTYNLNREQSVIEYSKHIEYYQNIIFELTK